MRVLVTGATGLLGNNIVRLLLNDGNQVRVLVRKGCDSRPLKNLDVEQIEGELSDSEAIEKAVSGVDAVVHSAAVVHIGWKRLEESRKVNVEGTRNVAEAARKAGAKLVHVSSVDALGASSDETVIDEESPEGEKIQCTYVVTKTEADHVVDKMVQDGLDAMVVHPGFMLGPWDWKPSSGRMLLEVAKNWTPIAPSGGGCTVDVRDVARGVILAIEKGTTGRHYILGGENISYLDLWKLFAEVTGTSKPSKLMGPVFRGIVGGAASLWAALTGKEGDVNSAAIKMGMQFHYYSSERAKQELGYAGRPLRESTEDAWNWFKENGYVK